MWHNMDERTCLKLHEQDMRTKFRGHGGHVRQQAPEVTRNTGVAAAVRAAILAAASFLSTASALWSSSIGQQRTKP